MVAIRDRLRSAHDSLATLLAGLLFWFSGVAALVYQVVWQRVLALHSGVGLYSVAMIVAAFMAGLGVGSHLGGKLSTRVAAARAFMAFAIIELGIAAMGAASPFVYYDWLYKYAVHLPTPSLRGALLHLLALAPPTILMGMSLPMLVRAVVTDIAGVERRIGWLYGINMLGAAAGALAGPWYLMPELGLAGAAKAAALANLGVALGALALGALSRFSTRSTVLPAPMAVLPALMAVLPAPMAVLPAPMAVLPALAEPREAAPPDHPGAAQAAIPLDPSGRRPLSTWLWLYAVSGFIALSLEVVWFRCLDVAVKSTAFTFGTVLAIYLFGSSLGALAAAPLASRIRRPLRAFLLLQCALLIVAPLPLIVLVWLPESASYLDWYMKYWSAYAYFRFGHASDATSVLRLYVVLPMLLFFLPTLLMGISFPVLQRAVHDDPATSGRKVGALQAANIAGCAAGSLLIGLVSLHYLGTTGTLRLLILLGLVFALIGVRVYGKLFALPAVAMLLLAYLVPSADVLWGRLHGVAKGADRAPIFVEDATSLVALTPERKNVWRLSINGKGNSRIPYGGTHSTLGALPAVIHPNPRDVAVIGLGSGDTAWASALRNETRTVSVFEISGPQPIALRRLVERETVLGVPTLLSDQRVSIKIEDGRKAIESGNELYDIIETDATWPQASGSGSLYSVEFFRAMGGRLKPGGVMCTWAPTDRVFDTFRAAFPYVLETKKRTLLLGSNQPIPIEAAVWNERAEKGRSYLGSVETDRLLETIASIVASTRPAMNSLNSDLYPRDEFAVPGTSEPAPKKARKSKGKS